MTHFRGVATRCNYLCFDRLDLQYAAKEIRREMSEPSVRAFIICLMIGQLRFKRSRLVWSFQSQLPTTQMYVSVDASWAACKRSTTPTSGGCAMTGSHRIKTWAKSPAIVANPFAVSELYAAVRVRTEGLGLITMAHGFGMELSVTVHIDANAAKGIVERKGLQKTRHTEGDILWLQEMKPGFFPLSNILGGDHPADLVTQNEPSDKVINFTRVLRLEYEEDRAKKAAKLHVVAEELGHGGDRRIRLGEDRVWTIENTGGRRELCMPYCMRGNPSSSLKLTASRTTTGVTRDGQPFLVSLMLGVRAGRAQVARLRVVLEDHLYREPPGRQEGHGRAELEHREVGVVLGIVHDQHRHRVRQQVRGRQRQLGLVRGEESLNEKGR